MIHFPCLTSNPIRPFSIASGRQVRRIAIPHTATIKITVNRCQVSGGPFPRRKPKYKAMAVMLFESACPAREILKLKKLIWMSG